MGEHQTFASQQLGKNQLAVLHHLQSSESPDRPLVVTLSELSDKTGLRGHAISAVLRSLSDRELIKKERIGLGTTPGIRITFIAKSDATAQDA